MPFDLVIRGGTVVDGTGRPGFGADVGISGRQITAVGDIPTSASENARIIDAEGLHISPGFIDVQGQDDLFQLRQLSDGGSVFSRKSIGAVQSQDGVAFQG